MEIHYVYTYFTSEGYSVIVTGPYDPNWGEASGNVKVVSNNYSKTFYASVYTNEISELKDSVLLKNICIYINDKLITCNNYNLTKFENKVKEIEETISKYINETVNVTIENITVIEEEIKEVTYPYFIILLAILVFSILIGIIILAKKIKS